jgi:putative ABC transport system permease protein
VVGVFKDFNQKSLYNPIAPLLLFYGANGNVIQLKTAAANVAGSISKVEAIWKKYFSPLRVFLQSCRCRVLSPATEAQAG